MYLKIDNASSVIPPDPSREAVRPNKQVIWPSAVVNAGAAGFIALMLSTDVLSGLSFGLQALFNI